MSRLAAIRQVVGLSVFIGMFALLALACLAFGLKDLGPAIDAAHGEGVLGTFHVTSRSCKSSSNCTLYGDFTSDDGAIRSSGTPSGIGKTPTSANGTRTYSAWLPA